MANNGQENRTPQLLIARYCNTDIQHFVNTVAHVCKDRKGTGGGRTGVVLVNSYHVFIKYFLKSRSTVRYNCEYM
jgi:hypothetical protein